MSDKRTRLEADAIASVKLDAGDTRPEIDTIPAALATIILLVSERADPNLILTRLRSFVAAEKEAHGKAIADLTRERDEACFALGEEIDNLRRDATELSERAERAEADAAALSEAGEHPGYNLARKIIEDWPDDGREFTRERWLAGLINTLCAQDRIRAKALADLTRERDEAIGECKKLAEVGHDFACKLVGERVRAERAEADAAALRQLVRDSFQAGRCSVEFHDKIMSFSAGRDLLERMERAEIEAKSMKERLSKYEAV